MYTLGRNVNHDPRSWAYRVTPAPIRTTIRWERLSPILDQGQIGSCTGNAGTGLLGTRPYYDPTRTLDETYAVQLYSDATKIDDADGTYPPTDTGSDGLSIAKVLKTRGLISAYQHAFGIDEAFSAIQQGPLLVGIPWTQGMYRPNSDGIVTPNGSIDGGHEIECVGYTVANDLWEFVNSWGTGWGINGHFFMTTRSFDWLLQQQGDIILPVPATVSTLTVDPKVAAAAFLDAWAVKRHSGENGKAATAWTTYRA